MLNNWVAGNFDAGPAPSEGAAAELTRAALDGTVGQGVYPGIEVGAVTMNPGIYSAPFDFRIDHAKVRPGDMTALMALPWQADFLKCGRGWWPAQRPFRAPQENGPSTPWISGYDHTDLVKHAMKLGVITSQGGRVYETGRDPAA
jgi:hypothetical protein